MNVKSNESKESKPKDSDNSKPISVLFEEANIHLINGRYVPALELYNHVIEAMDTFTCKLNKDGHSHDQNDFSHDIMSFRALSHKIEAQLRLKDEEGTRTHTRTRRDTDDMVDPILTLRDTEAATKTLLAVTSQSDPQPLLLDGEEQEFKNRIRRVHEWMKERNVDTSSSSVSEYLKQETEPLANVDVDVDVDVDFKSTQSTQSNPSLKTQTPVAAPAPAPRHKKPTCPKYQYYQNDTYMTIAILEPNVQPQHLTVDFGLDTLHVVLEKEYDHDSDSSTTIPFTVISNKRTLFDAIHADKCKITYKEEKVLIKLRKCDRHEWHDLFGSGASKDQKAKEQAKMQDKTITKEESKGGGNGHNGSDTTSNEIAQEGNKNKGKPKPKPKPKLKHRPYASDKDWDAIDREIALEEVDEKTEGEEAVNALFQSIYKDADEDTKRAMIKSFQTSGGTCLSTNWKDVQKTDYEKNRQAPKGSEWKNWEGDRLPQQKDD